MAKVESPKAIVSAKQDIVLALRPSTHGKVKDLHTHVKTLNITIQTTFRKAATGQQASKLGKPDAVKTELAKAMEFLLEHNITLSVFQAKGGMLCCKMACQSEDKFQRLQSFPIIKKGIIRVDKATRQGTLSAVQDKVEPTKQIIGRLETVVTQVVGTELRSRRALPGHLDWTSKVFGYRVRDTSGASTEVNWTHNGVVVFFSGNATIARLRTENARATARS